MRKIVFLMCMLGVGLMNLCAQFVYENRVYSPLIKTVTLRKTTELFSQPVIVLQKGERLLLEFDELREDTRRYEYTLIHCNHDWTQSSLNVDEYSEGFETQAVEGFDNSFNTIQRYVHYSQTIPSDNMRLTRGGNYVIKVFTEGNPDNVIMTRRMYVVDDRADIELDIKASSDASLYRAFQEVNVKVGGKNGAFFSNPEQFMNVYVQQNGNDKTAHKLQMRGMSDSKVDYSFSRANQFAGGNEFRFFDFTSMRRKSQYVAEFDYIDNKNLVYLRPIELKHNLAHASDKDLNGGFYIRNEFSDDNGIASDYAWVNFVLDKDISTEGNYYVIGAMNDWRADSQSKMTFKDGKYHLSLYLKQGYYNYTIAFLDNNNQIAPNGLYTADGNFSETENDYSVFVYYHNFSDDCDELIGFYKLNFHL